MQKRFVDGFLCLNKKFCASYIVSFELVGTMLHFLEICLEHKFCVVSTVRLSTKYVREEETRSYFRVSLKGRFYKVEIIGACSKLAAKPAAQTDMPPVK